MHKSDNQNCKVKRRYYVSCEPGELCDPEAGSFYDICAICKKKEYEQIKHH